MMKQAQMMQANMKTEQSVLDKMMQKQELHVTEFGALCGCQIDYMIENDKPEGAVSWFEMWEQGYPDDPALKNYEHKIAMIDVFAKLKDGFTKSHLFAIYISEWIKHHSKPAE